MITEWIEIEKDREEERRAYISVECSRPSTTQLKPDLMQKMKDLGLPCGNPQLPWALAVRSTAF